MIANFFIFSSGIVWEEKKKRFRALNVKTGEILEKGYQKYATELELGHTPPEKVHLENKLEVRWRVLVDTVFLCKEFQQNLSMKNIKKMFMFI